ncbi:hypothetical protein K439DRAFT_1357445 [Ramaria rubella]|nr:hypothetical protein K439DRAFT_1357445 [Ramaria rubella]
MTSLTPRALVLVCNVRIKMDLSRKTKPCYISRFMVIRGGCTGTYTLAELDGSISKL